LIEDDERFFFPEDGGKSKNHNHDQNIVLMKTIDKGYRETHWDILCKVPGLIHQISRQRD